MQEFVNKIFCFKTFLIFQNGNTFSPGTLVEIHKYFGDTTFLSLKQITAILQNNLIVDSCDITK